MRLKCLVVDDEPIARKGMAEYIQDVDFLEWVGESGNADQAQSFLQKNPVDLMFLDIQMPGPSGLDFLRTLENPPMVVITTAFTEFALEGFELDVMDYLVKPIPFARFLKTANKALDFYRLKHKPQEAEESPYIFVKCNGKLERLGLDEILFVQAMQNYVIIHLANEKYIVYMTMSGMGSKLPAEKFMRVHKSYIAALDKVNSIQDHDLIIGQFKIPVSRNLKEQVSERIIGGNLLKR